MRGYVYAPSRVLCGSIKGFTNLVVVLQFQLVCRTLYISLGIPLYIIVQRKPYNVCVPIHQFQALNVMQRTVSKLLVFYPQLPLKQSPMLKNLKLWLEGHPHFNVDPQWGPLAIEWVSYSLLKEIIFTLVSFSDAGCSKTRDVSQGIDKRLFRTGLKFCVVNLLHVLFMKKCVISLMTSLHENVVAT